MTVETKIGFDKPTYKNNCTTENTVKSIDIFYCPDCGEETFIDSRNTTGEPDNWEDFVVCPTCLWRYEEMEEEVKELEFC